MDILKTALKITSEDRHKDYGDCDVEFKKTAKMWSDIAGYARLGDLINK